MILETRDRVPHRAPHMKPASPSACVSASLSVSLMNKSKILKKKKREREIYTPSKVMFKNLDPQERGHSFALTPRGKQMNFLRADLIENMSLLQLFLVY